jgi:ParB-like chromosome segregation protein Spo0J
VSVKRRAPLARRRDERASEIRAEYAEVAGHRARLPLAQIGERVHGDTRALDPRHVQELSESVEVLGLITPLTVDSEGALLAGGHRRAALALLRERAPERFEELFSEGVPVHRLALNSVEQPVEALQLEVEENTQRLNYTAEEIREAARRLEEAGYERLKGRPREGQRSLKRALQQVFRLSDRRIQQLLNAPPPSPLAARELSSPQTLELTDQQRDEQLKSALSPLKRPLSRALKGALSADLDEAALSPSSRKALDAARALLNALQGLEP